MLRTAIGFDRLFRQLDLARGSEAANGYPPYNIEKTGEDTYVLTMAVAGFGPDDLEVTTRENTLTIAGKASQSDEGRRFLHRGIAGRAFERRFVLADHIVVKGARLENGLLHIELERIVPEALKPRRIPIQAGAAPRHDRTAPAAEEAAAPQAKAA
nr:Hsp20 family protein [Caldovatus aquaticus]